MLTLFNIDSHCMGEVYDLARTLLVSIENCMNESEYKRTASSYSEYNSNPVLQQALETQLGLASFLSEFPPRSSTCSSPSFILKTRNFCSPLPTPARAELLSCTTWLFSEVNETLAGCWHLTNSAIHNDNYCVRGS